MKKYRFTVTVWRDYVDGCRLFDSDQGFDTFEQAIKYADYFVCVPPGNKSYCATIWRDNCRVEDIG